jgi:hypothetical protein
MNERNLQEGQWEDRKQWSLGVGQRGRTFWNRLLYIYIDEISYYYYYYYYYFLRLCSPARDTASSFMRFLEYTQRRATTIGPSGQVISNEIRKFLNINSNYFPQRLSPVGYCNGGTVSCLCGRDWTFMLFALSSFFKRLSRSIEARSYLYFKHHFSDNCV